MDGTTNTLCAASMYERAEDLWLMTAYFNPVGYQSRRHNYEIFRDSIVRSGLHCVTIECAFGDAPFTLPPTPDVIQVRARHVMWQKERLLNLAIARLPDRCAKVAWLDCDILFTNRRWAVETARLLDHYPLVQPYDTIMKLPRGCLDYRGEGEVLRSFGAAYILDPGSVRAGRYVQHGETGGVWAARRDVVARAGLYDASIIGGGDHLFAHGVCADWTSPCIERLIGTANGHTHHFARWSRDVSDAVRGRIACVPGTIFHLWHGERPHRRYTQRQRELQDFVFDPDRDIRLGTDGCWEWASDKAAMHRWAADYFVQRHEDGDSGHATGAREGIEAGA